MTLRDLDEEDISDDLAWNLVFSFKKDDNKMVMLLLFLVVRICLF